MVPTHFTVRKLRLFQVNPGSWIEYLSSWPDGYAQFLQGHTVAGSSLTSPQGSFLLSQKSSLSLTPAISTSLCRDCASLSPRAWLWLSRLGCPGVTLPGIGFSWQELREAALLLIESGGGWHYLTVIEPVLGSATSHMVGSGPGSSCLCAQLSHL